MASPAKGSKFEFSGWNATRFFVPLCIQAMSQGLTYPLVGTIVAHGPGEAVEYSAFAQGLMIMFLLGCVGYGLVTTGMVFAKDRVGYVRFARVTVAIMFGEAALQILLALPGISTLVFGHLLGLEGAQLEIARWSMFWSLPAQMGFFMRNIPQVILYNEHETSVANAATVMRIVITAAVAPLFRWAGLVGWQWGMVCFTLPVLLEASVMWFIARSYVRALPRKLAGMGKVTAMKVFFFTIPLSLGGFMLMFAVFVLNAIINRTEDGVSMLAIHLVAIGLINPLSYGALRNQAVAIGFPPAYDGDGRTFRFAVCSGLALSLPLLIMLIPALSGWYFCHIQNLLPSQEPLARNALWVAMLFPVLQAMRGHAEGLAAYRRRPKAVLMGQAVFFAVLTATLLLLFALRMPGYLMGITALCCASAATLAAIRLSLSKRFSGTADMPGQQRTH